jgi:hypothetical protein
MSNDLEPTPSGWTPLKVIGIIFGVLGMIGFGLCSLVGVVLGSDSATSFQQVLPYVFVGLVFTALFIWLIVAIVRSARGQR